MKPIFQTCLKCVLDDKCADDIPPKFKREIGAFLKNVVAVHAGDLL